MFEEIYMREEKIPTDCHICWIPAEDCPCEVSADCVPPPSCPIRSLEVYDEKIRAEMREKFLKQRELLFRKIHVRDKQIQELERLNAEVRKAAIEEFATYLTDMMCVERESLGIKYKQGTFSDRDIEQFAKELIENGQRKDD